MTEQQQGNPLQQFYRQEAFRIKIPSKGNFYDEKVLTLDDDLELGVLPMTAQDEILLKSPDALLSGKAISDVIKSCIPEVKNPKKLLSCDIDALMISIRRASYGDEADLSAECPKCEHKGTFGIDLDTLLTHTETLDSSYEVILPQGLTIFLRPGTYETLVKQYKAAFENTKAQRAIAASANEDAAMHLLSRAFKELAKLNFELINDAIVKVVFTDENNEEQVITNKKHIGEFIANIDKTSVDVIDEKLAEINKVGIQRTFEAVCKECGEKWEADVEFNPVNFS